MYTPTIYDTYKLQAVFWNNYVREPKRPMEPLFPPTQQSNNGQSYANSAPNPSYAATTELSRLPTAVRLPRSVPSGVSSLSLLFLHSAPSF
jgi:hypothetical protein